MEGGQKRCLCCLPAELLLIVLGYLSVRDYLSFRAVCKCWRSVFSKCSEFISQNHTQRRLPWFMFLRIEESPMDLQPTRKTQRLVQTMGKFGDLSTRRIYNIDFPELSETQILLSRHGWLLLFSDRHGSSSLFFLNPFSRARIDIPLLDVSKLCLPVFDVSAPPTSPECILFAICYKEFRIIINTCRRGESSWKTNSYKQYWHESDVANAVFVNGIWYCLHNSGSFSVFDAITGCWRYLGLPEGMRDCYHATVVSYVIKRADQVYLCIHGSVFYEVLLKEPLKVTRDFCDDYWQFHVEHLIRTSPERAIEKLQNELQVYSFNAHAWCCSCDATNGDVSFRWHRFRSCVNVRFCLDDTSCLRNNKDCSTIVAWIEPVWVQPSAELDWMS